MVHNDTPLKIALIEAAVALLS